MPQVFVKSEVTNSSLGEFTTQAAALNAIAEYILASVPVHISVILVKDQDRLLVYRVHTKMKRGGVQVVSFKKIMQFEMRDEQ